MASIIDYKEWTQNHNFLDSKKYKLIKNNKRCFVAHHARRNVYSKIFKKPLSPEHSTFLLELLINPQFYSRYTRFLTELLVDTLFDGSQLIYGYNMKGGKTLNTRSLKEYLKKTKTRWMKDMEQYQFYYSDFKPDNLITINNRISLIDLESIRRITKTVPPPLNPKSNRIGIASAIKIELYDIGWYYAKIFKIQRKCKPISDASNIYSHPAKEEIIQESGEEIQENITHNEEIQENISHVEEIQENTSHLEEIQENATQENSRRNSEEEEIQEKPKVSGN